MCPRSQEAQGSTFRNNGCDVKNASAIGKSEVPPRPKTKKEALRWAMMGDKNHRPFM